jgi:hypothetical protein
MRYTVFSFSSSQIASATDILHAVIDRISQRVDASRWSVGSRRCGCSWCAVACPCDVFRPARQLPNISACRTTVAASSALLAALTNSSACEAARSRSSPRATVRTSAPPPVTPGRINPATSAANAPPLAHVKPLVAMSWMS